MIMTKHRLAMPVQLLLVLLLSGTCLCQVDPAPIIYPGQVNIGFVANIHGPPDNGSDSCGPLRPEAVQRAMAAVWAAHQANFKKDDPQELNIGVYIFDTCGKEEVAERQVYRLLGHVGHVQTTDCSEKKIPPLFAVITEGDTDHLKVPLSLLNSFSVPVISANGPPLPKMHLLSTAPSTSALSRAAVSVLRQLRLVEVAVLAEDVSANGFFGDFTRQAEVSGMQAVQMESTPEPNGGEQDVLATLKMVANFGKSRLKAVVFLVSSENALKLLQLVDEDSLPQIPWVIVTPFDISKEVANSFADKQIARLQKVLLLSPEFASIPEFDEYFQQLLQEETVKYHPLLIEFLKSVSDNKTEFDATSPMAHLTFPRSDVSSTVKAVWTLSAALRNVQRRSCRRGTDCLLYLRRSLSSYVARAASDLDHVVQGSSLSGMRLKFQGGGELASAKYMLRGFNAEGDVLEIGFYSDEAGLVINHDILMPVSEFVFVAPLTASDTSTESVSANTTEDVNRTAEYVEWRILDYSEEGRTSQEGNKDQNDLNKSIGLVLTLHDGKHFSGKNTSSGRELEHGSNSVDLGPSYDADRPASNYRSISLTSHQEPKMNDAYVADPGLRSDRRIDPPKTTSPPPLFEDIHVVPGPGPVSAWLGRPWALSVLGVSGFLVLATLYTLVFLMVKACEGSLKKTNCCLASTQLLALLSLYAAAALFTWKPSALMCGLQRLMPNVSLAFCYGSLLLKGMYLRAQNSLGLGGSVNRCNQILTLLFVVGVQIALEVQWWLMHPPALSKDAFECLIGKTEILQSQIYVAVLLLMATAMAISTRKIPYNQSESKSLIATTLTCLLLFLSWGVACWLLPHAPTRNIAAPSALLATALTVLLGIFGPQLFAIHKYGGHKPLSYAESLSTVFTMFKDLDNVSSGGTTARGRKNAKTLETPFAGEMTEGSRNPIYSDYQSAYP